MRFLLLFLLLIGSLVIWQGCKTQEVSFKDYKGPKLMFGEGGGFAGSVNEYIVFPNGQIFLKKNDGAAVAFAKIKKRKAKKLFKKADEMDLIKMSYKKPGNMYYYIGYKKDKEFSKSTWGREEHLINEPLDSFFREFFELLPKSTSTGTSSTK